MQVHTPGAQVADGDFTVWTNPGRDRKPFGVIEVGPGTCLFIESDDDADRLIKAAVEAKRQRAALAVPHAWVLGGYLASCAECGVGKNSHPAPDATTILGAAIEAGTPVIIAEDEPPCGARPYPAGSEGDDGTECALPRGHDGEHDDVVIAPPSPGWRDEATGLVGGPIYDYLNRLSCGCTFHGPLTWPAGRKARCDEHGAVETVAAPPAPGELPAYRLATTGELPVLPVGYLPLDRPTLAGGPA